MSAKTKNLHFSHVNVSLIAPFELYISNIIFPEFNECAHALLYSYSSDKGIIYREFS